MRICDQPEVLDRLAPTLLRRVLCAVPELGRERCLIFAGPMDVGKTVTAQNVAKLVFGEGAFLRIDCGEFRTVGSVAERIGNRNGDMGRLVQAFSALLRDF